MRGQKASTKKQKGEKMVIVILCILMTILLYAVSAFLQCRRAKKSFEKRQEQYKRGI